MWPLSRHDDTGAIVTKIRLPVDPRRRPDQRVHPGQEWFYVLSGYGAPAELIGIFDRHGERAHLTA